MKIQCDVCGHGEASVFCCADEAALCDSCDRRVHRANKLAGKHRRFSLVNTSSPSLAPRCDICQEKTAFLFCQEDRAILCRDCDVPIHSANELTKRHNRFLLTGVKLSPIAINADASDSDTVEEEMMTMMKKKKKVGTQASNLTTTKSTKSCSSGSNTEQPVVLETEELGASANNGGNSSSISDYLIKTLPGWRVEDLLFDCPSPFPLSFTPGFSKMGVGEDLSPFMEADLDSRGVAGGDVLWWVPQVPSVPLPNTTACFHHASGQQRRQSDDGFAVPQMMTQPPFSNKRPRNLW